MLPGQGPGTSPTFRMAVSPDFASDNTVFAATFDGLFRSTDRGSSWQEKGQGIDSSLQIIALAISPAFATDKTVFAVTTNGVFRSTDAGNSWLSLNEGLNVDRVNVVAVSPDFDDDSTIFAGTDSGVFSRE